MSVRIHYLKCHPRPFEALAVGVKTHEVRKADRDYRVGDLLVLREWVPDIQEDKTLSSGDSRGEYTGREIQRRVTHITDRGTYGIPDDLLVMSVRNEDRRGH